MQSGHNFTRLFVMVVKYNCENGGFTAIEGAKATISHLTVLK